MSVSAGVHVSRTIIRSDRLEDIPVRIMNVRKEPVTFKAGTNIASLQQVTVLDSVLADELLRSYGVEVEGVIIFRSTAASSGLHSTASKWGSRFIA